MNGKGGREKNPAAPVPAKAMKFNSDACLDVLNPERGAVPGELRLPAPGSFQNRHLTRHAATFEQRQGIRRCGNVADAITLRNEVTGTFLRRCG